MSVMNLTEKYEMDDDVKNMIVYGINYLIYPILIKDPSNIIYEDVTAGAVEFRNWETMEYSRYIGPSCLNFDNITQEDIDPYDFTTLLTEKDGMWGDSLFTQYDYTIPRFNKDNVNNLLTDLLAYATMCIVDERHEPGFAALSLFNSLLASMTEKIVKDKVMMKRGFVVIPPEL